jgi:copper chaperone NosL
MKKHFNLLIILSGMIFVSACTRTADQTPREINFDRDICINCLMGLADQKFSAQSINLRNEVLWYDDLGCLVEYMKSPDWETYGGDDAVSYIGDAETGQWVRVEDAWYVYGVDTPMGYGYAAYKENREGAFDFETTVQRINDGVTMREDFLEKKKMLHHDMK